MKVCMWVFVLASVFAASGVLADTIQVTTLTDELTDGNGVCSLREAIATVNDASDEDAGTTGYADCMRQMDAGTLEGRFTVLLDIPEANDLAPDVAEEVFALTLEEDPAPENEQGNAAGDLLIAAGVKIRLQGAGMDITALDAGGRDRHLFIEPGAEVELVQMTFRNGSAPANEQGVPTRGGSVHFEDDSMEAAPLLIEACRFEDNLIVLTEDLLENEFGLVVSHGGGAVYATHVRVTQSEFLRNHLTLDPDRIGVIDPVSFGGALYVSGLSQVADSLFGNNSAASGAAILSRSEGPGGDYHHMIERSRFIRNHSYSRIVSIQFWGASTGGVTSKGNLFYENQGQGALFSVLNVYQEEESAFPTRVEHNMFVNNSGFKEMLDLDELSVQSGLVQFNTFYQNNGATLSGSFDGGIFGNLIAQRVLTEGYDEGGEESCDELDFRSLGGNIFSQVAPGSPCLTEERFPDDVILPLQEVEAMVEEVELGLVRPRLDSPLVEGVDCAAGLQYPAVEEDFLAAPRPQGLRCDIGAVERSADQFVVRVNRRVLEPTEFCPFGLEEVTVGYDLDEDGVVDPGRVHTRLTGCIDPAYEMKTEIQAVPVTEDCPEGYLLLSGQDLDGSGNLEEEETTLSQLRCFTEEAPGNNCEFGGMRVEMGLDRDGDGAFDMDETEVTYLCDGGGTQPLTQYEMLEASEACPLGAVRRLLGVDDDEDGVLDVEEVAGALLECKREATEEECAHGGVRTEEGEDANRDGVIDAAVLNQSLVCYPAPAPAPMPTGGSDGTGQSDGSAGDSGGCSCRVGAFQNPANSLLVFAVGLYLIARTRSKKRSA